MNTKSKIIKKVLYFIIPLLLIAAVMYRLKNNKKAAELKVYHYNKEQPVSVQADTLQLEYIDAENSFSGIFEPNKETKISSEVQGKINSVLVDLGSYVSKGQPLIQLDNSLLKLQLQTVEVQIEGLQDDVNRYAILTKADAVQGVQLEKATLGLKSAKVQQAILLEQINKTTIKAPFNGIVTAKLNEEGAFAAPGIPLLQITDIANLKFTVNIPEKDLAQFKINQNYTITADIFPGMLLKGKAIMVGSKANIGNTFPVQFLVKNTSVFTIKSGMFGKAHLKETSPDKGIVIPTSSITGGAGQMQVYLIKNEKAVLQKITVSRNIQNQSVVSGGLQQGDVLITNGFINLYDGAHVIVK